MNDELNPSTFDLREGTRDLIEEEEEKGSDTTVLDRVDSNPLDMRGLNTTQVPTGSTAEYTKTAGSDKRSRAYRGDEHRIIKKKGGTGDNVEDETEDTNDLAFPGEEAKGETNEDPGLGNSQDPNSQNLPGHSQEISALDEAEELRQARIFHEKFKSLSGEGRYKVIRRRAVNDVLPMMQELLPSGSVGSLSEEITKKVKEIAEMRKNNPEIEKFHHVRGVKFLNLPIEFNQATIAKIWYLVNLNCSASPHNSYLNLMTYVFKYTMALGEDFAATLYEDLSKDDDLIVFAKYLNQQKSTSFHVSELPSAKYNDNRLNLLRLNELKCELADLLLAYLGELCQFRRYSSKIHWNSQEKISLLSSSSDPNPNRNFRDSMKFGDDVIKSDIAKNLRDTAFLHDVKNSREARIKFGTHPTFGWRAQELQETIEKPYLPKFEGMYFAPLRSMIDAVPGRLLENGKPFPGWYSLYSDGVCNIAGESNLDGSPDVYLGYNNGAFDLLGKMPNKYQDKVVEATDAQNNKTSEIEASKTSFFLQTFSLTWTAAFEQNDTSDLIPETTFRLMDRNKARKGVLCKGDSKKTKRGGQGLIYSEAKINIEDMIITKNEAIGKRIMDQALSDNGFVMVDPTLQFKTETSSSGIMEWLMNMNFTGLEGPIEIMQLYEIAVYCKGLAKKGLIREQNRLLDEGVMLPESR